MRTPALAYIAAMHLELLEISPHVNALAKKSGGSLMRVYRDTRFSKDKTPYKTNIGIQFRHKLGKDVHAPGYYLHISNEECFIGVGIWRPDSRALGKIRDAIIERDQDWGAVRDDTNFNQHFHLVGDRLSKPPRGFNKHHPLIEYLKWKDYLAIAPLSPEQICSQELTTLSRKRLQQGRPLMKFLCEALEIDFI